MLIKHREKWKNIMKKTALLFTILCAGQLYGMDPTSLDELRRTGPQCIGDLPKELQEQITQNAHDILKNALAKNDNLEDTVKAIKAASAAQGIRYDNLKDFTRNDYSFSFGPDCTSSSA